MRPREQVVGIYGYHGDTKGCLLHLSTTTHLERLFSNGKEQRWAPRHVVQEEHSHHARRPRWTISREQNELMFASHMRLLAISGRSEGCPAHRVSGGVMTMLDLTLPCMSYLPKKLDLGRREAEIATVMSLSHCVWSDEVK